MKKLTIAFFVMLLTGTVAFAQGPRTRPNEKWQHNNFPNNDRHKNCDYNHKGPGKHKQHSKKHKKHDHMNDRVREYDWKNDYPNRKKDQREPYPIF